MKKRIKKNNNIKGYYNGELSVKANPAKDLKIKSFGDTDVTQKLNPSLIAQSVSGGAQLLNTAISGQKATVGTALSGAAQGAAAGMAFGPIGAGIGAGVGLISGSIGSSGSVNENTGEIEDPSGIAGFFGPSKLYLQNRSNRIKNGIISRELNNQIAADYYDLYGQNNYTMAAQGGIIPNTKAYLSKGELIKDSDGIYEVPGGDGKANAKDDVLANVEVGSQVLSNNLKVPGTNKTYAQMGKRLLKPNKNVTDKYAEGTAKANEIMYNILLQDLELNKNSRQIGKKYAKGTNWISDVADYTSGIVGPIANINVDKPEKINTYTYQPRYTPNNYDVQSQINAINENDAVARYNMRNISSNTGAGMAYGLQAAAQKNRQLSDIYSLKANIENQYAAQNANIYNQWANQYANARHIAATEQAQNDAAYRNIKRKGLTDLSTTIQSINKDKRLANKDRAILAAMSQMLQYGMPSKDYEQMIKMFD